MVNLLSILKIQWVFRILLFLFSLAEVAPLLVSRLAHKDKGVRESAGHAIVTDLGSIDGTDELRDAIDLLFSLLLFITGN